MLSRSILWTFTQPLIEALPERILRELTQGLHDQVQKRRTTGYTAADVDAIVGPNLLSVAGPIARRAPRVTPHTREPFLDLLLGLNPAPGERRRPIGGAVRQ